MTPAGSVGSDERLRLFLALQLPPATIDVLVLWQAAHLRGGRIVPREHLHITLAFLGSRPAVELAWIVDALRVAVGTTGPMAFAPTASRVASRSSASTAPSRGPGFRTSPCSASGSGRGSTRHCRRREHSFRPVRLLSYLDCTRPAPGTRCSNASR